MKLPLRMLVCCVACTNLDKVGAQERANIGSADDLWDVSRGTMVIRNSPLDTGLGDPSSYDARDILGGDFGNFRPERQAIVFSDELAPGFVNFVEWRTKSPVTIRSFRLYAAADEGGLYRGIAKFRLLAKPADAAGFSVLLHEFETTLPAVYLDQSFLVIESDTKTVTASDFRAEFISRTALDGNHGPRVIELDGFQESLQTQASIRMSEVEICWESISGVRYRVEFKSQLPNSNWLTIGDESRTGSGGRMCVSDRLPIGAESRFYRVRRLD